MEGASLGNKMAGLRDRFRLTSGQEKALELEKHISVTANAGSGKTRVLVERYVEAIRNGIGVEQILCLTFTEKAALELRQKIIDRINSENGHQPSAPEAHEPTAQAVSLLRKARANMLEANISTIHSFCSQVLREFPVEAGIDANFKVLEDFDSASLKDDACDQAVREMLAVEHENHGRVYNFLVRVGYKRTLQLLKDLLDSREKIEHIKITGNPLLMDEGAVRQHWKTLSDAVLRVVKENIRLKKANVQSEIDSLEEALNTAASGLDDLLDRLKTLLDALLTKEAKPRSGVAIDNSAAISSDTALTVLEVAHEALSGFSSERTGCNVKDYFLLLNTLMELYDSSVENYGRKKYSMSALDFDDLQIRTMMLLRENENVRSSLASRFKHIMVDEFQDTNFLQYNIFLNLLDNFASDARLFVVGDPKQSIYRFRNAQVEVSIRTEKDLSERTNGVSISLPESFRMNSSLASFVNDVFARVMGGDRFLEVAGLSSVNQIEYNALVPRRPEGRDFAVEIYLARKGQDSETSDDNDADDQNEGASPGEMQALFVASRIRGMIDKREEVNSVRLDEQSRRVTYGDIAVLLRSRTKLTLLEEALSEKGVPFVVTSGIGFYSAQEVFDLTNYLTFLLDNDSDIDLLTVIRSPFFGISENELYRISQCKGETLFKRLQTFASSEKATDEVKYAVSVLNEETQLAHRLTIPQLINRILERTGWLGAYRLSPTGGQRIANLRKLLGIAREFEGRGFNNLYDFVERIKYLKDTAREGQAPVEEAIDAVKVMTVHAAKGLEFPVVIVPFCDLTTNRRQSLIINDRVGALPFLQNEVPPELSLYRRLENRNEQAEIVRLFYVACTRAMDKLILTTAPKKTKSRSISSFGDVLGRSLDFSIQPSFYEYPGGRVLVHAEIPAVSDRTISDEKKQGKKRGENLKLGKILLDPVPANIDGEIYSATLLQTFKLCPTKYFLKYRLGMPIPEMEDGGQRAGTLVSDSGYRLDDYDDSILSTVKGELVHATLQSLLTSGKLGEASVEVNAERVVSSRVGKTLNKEANEKLLNHVIMNVRNAIATLKAIATTDKIYVEQTVTRKFGSDFLTGTIDLLVEDEEGLHIFDYKTNRLSRSDSEIYAEYEIQMKLYASLCSRLKPEQNKFDVTIIFTREAGRFLTRTYSREDLDAFDNELETMLSDIKAIEPVVGQYPPPGRLPTTTQHCPECEYFVGEQTKKCLLDRTERNQQTAERDSGSSLRK